MAKSLDITIDQGADYSVLLPPVTTASGSVLNLTGYTVVSQMRRGYTSTKAIDLSATVSNASQGLITLSMVASQTGGLSPVRYVYDVLLIANDNTKTRIFEGLVIVNPGVSQKPNTSIVIPYIPDDFGGGSA